MTEGQNLVADSQISGMSQSISDGSKVVGGSVDVVGAAADGAVKVELGSGVGLMAKKKRGRPPRAQVKLPPAKKNKEVEEEEDVCFICFDGGSLVLCDRRGCPKAYHPACIKRDEAFFESAAKWNCGWHICSMCEKTAHHMCYTCTYSLCRSCIRKSDYVCVRGEKGFCTICMKTIMLIENNGQGEDGKVQADFDDKLSWEYLFKVYWVYLKGKLSLTLEELTQAKNPWKISTPILISPPQLSTIVHNKPLEPKTITFTPPPPPPTTTTSTTTDKENLESNESKRRKIEDHITTPVITEKPLNNKETETITMAKDWATKELLDFVSHMKNGDTTVISRINVQQLLMEYIKQNNLRDPKKKNQIICDSRLKNLFGKARVGHIEMLTHLEYHFFVEDDSMLTTVNSSANAILDDPDWTNENKNIPVVVKEKKRRKRSGNKGEERVLLQNKLDEFGAVDVHNMKLIYLKKGIMVNLLEDSGGFHGKVVGSIVRIRISGSDQKVDMYRLVKVVGTSKVDVPYKIDSKLTDIMLEVLNLDKKETISIDTISDQDFTEEECRRLQQSIKCGLVKHFTVGEIQEKAVSLQPVRLDDWMETEMLQLNNSRDIASEKGHRKGYRECVEKLQLLKTLDERERRLQEIPEVHSDPKMNPHYESDDTEEYFNKEHGDHMESKISVVNMKKSPKKRAGSSTDASVRPKKPEQSKIPNLEDGNTKNAPGKPEHEMIDCNGSTVTKSDNQATISSSVSNNPVPPIPSSVPPRTTFSENDTIWHYLDPNGKVQGPFSILQLQRWSTTGYFPDDMRVWANHEGKSVRLNDLLREYYGNDEENENGNMVSGEKDCNENDGNVIPIPVPVPVPIPIPSAPIPKLSDGSSGHGQNWNVNNENLNFNRTSVVSLTMSNESTGNGNSGDITKEREQEQILTASKEPETSVFELPGPIPKKVNEEDKKIQSVPESKIPIPDSGNPPSWSSASSLVVGGAKLPDAWGVKPVEVAIDHVATPTSNIDQNIDQNDQNAPHQSQANDLPTWHGMGEMIEFSTLAEESVSDLLAEVDAMESQYGLPSPTSRRNSFVDDLFNGSFDEFSPTPDQGTRSDGFSSSGDIQLPCQSGTPDEHLVGFDFMKMSQNPFIAPQRSNPNPNLNSNPNSNHGNMGFKWPESEGMIDINRSAKADSDDVDIDAKVDVENRNYIPNVGQIGISYGGVVQRTELNSGELMHAPKTSGVKMGMKGREEEEGEFVQAESHQPPLLPPPPPPPPLTLGLDPFDPRELDSDKSSHSGRIDWDQRRYGGGSGGGGGGGGGGGERYNNSSNRGHHVEDTGYSRSSRSSWNKQSLLGGGGGGSSGGGGGGSGYSRPPSKGQKVCRFYESGRCKKGASCKYLHP